MAPEQMRDLKSVDPRTDIYALGVILYQLATGGWLPYQESGGPSSYYELSAAEIYHRQLTQPPVDPRTRVASVSERWASIILAALHPDPARRPQTTRQLAIMLAEATPGDNFAPPGVEIVRTHARELLEIGNMLETVRAPKPSTSGRPDAPSRYQLGQRLGEGGMAEVFRGTMSGAEGFARDVAIKRVLPGFSTLPQFASMFVQEARIASQLVHPNVVQVLDFDRDPDGRLFLVMELVEGRSLDALADSGLLPAPVIIFVISEVLRGLGFAHELPNPKQGMRGIVHRDVSPHNVLLSWEGAVKVSDFGIAKAREASAATASTMIKGKAGYMSPEQANGEELDGRSDLFAVGIMLWELLTGRPLFVGTTQEAIAQVFFRPIPLPSTVHPVAPDLEAVAMRLLERDKNARYRTAEAVVADLARCRGAARDGRGELVRLLAERFPMAVSERASGKIESDGSVPPGRVSNLTVPARPLPATPGAKQAATTLGSAASVSVASESRRGRSWPLVGVLAVLAIGGGVTLAIQRSRSEDPAPAAPAPTPPNTSAMPDASSSVAVTIETSPPGASVEIDHKPRGSSPVSVRLTRGAHVEVVASKDGFSDATATIDPAADGQVVSLMLAAKALPQGIDAGVLPTGIAKPTKPTKVRTSTEPKHAGSDTHKSGFDPNEVGGD
jgi:serine/threonine-protein kinase